jgi:hypothetical protein
MSGPLPCSGAAVEAETVKLQGRMRDRRSTAR